MRRPGSASGWAAGCRAFPAPRAPASTEPIGSRSSTTLGGPTRDSARCLSSPGTGVAILTMASAAASWNLRVAGSIEAARCRRAPGQCRLEFAHLLGHAIAAEPLPDRQQRGAADLAWPRRKTALDEKRFKRAEQQPRRIVGARGRFVLFLRPAHDLAQLLEHHIGDDDFFAPLDGALELPHQQRLRLRRELREIVPQPLDRCLAHAPGVDACVLGDGKTRPLPS